MSERQPSPDHVIDACLNGDTRDASGDAVDRLLHSSPDLATEVERQRRIHGAIKRLMSPPPTRRLGAIADAAIAARLPRPTARPRADSVRRRRYAAAAALATALGGAWLVWDAVQSRLGGRGYVAPPRTTLAAVYRAEVSTGFRPDWRCETDEQFAGTFAERLGRPLLLGTLPAGTEALGLSYCNCMTPRTIYLLATVQGTSVLVFVDRIERDIGPTAPDGLNLFRRQLGELVLYELSPLEAPALLASFRDPTEEAG